MGRGGGRTVIVLTLYSNNPSSNPAEAYSYFFKICVWKEQILTKKGWRWPIKRINQTLSLIIPFTLR